jgi:hypothetical protein
MSEMPVISGCDEKDCFYNTDGGCHAPAINVGGPHPKCDTFARSGSHIARQPVGRVGACHVTECQHNSQRMCTASAIAVGRHGDHPDCITFAPATK